MSFYEILADTIVCFHFAYIAYVVFGQLAIMIGWPLGWKWIRNPWFRVSHLVMILIVAFEAVIEFECPLTTWERDLRVAAGQPEEQISFIGRFIRDIMFFDNSWEKVLAVCYYAVAAIVVATVFLVPPRFRRQPPNGEPTDASAPSNTVHAR